MRVDELNDVTIWIQGEIALQIMRHKNLAAPYRVYVVARALDEAGRGLHLQKDLTDAVASVCGLTKDAVRKQLTHGDGIFWARNAGQVAFRNPDRVARELGAEDAGRTVMPYPLSKAQGTITQFRAVLFNTVQPRKPKRVTRGAQAAFTGVSETTQRRWERSGEALHRDGEGHMPVDSPVTFDDWSEALNVGTDDLGTRDARSMAKLIRQDGLKGLFACGGKLLRQSPKTFIRSGKARRRSRNRPKHNTITSGIKSQWGSGDTLTRVKFGTRTVKYLPTHGTYRIERQGDRVFRVDSVLALAGHSQHAGELWEILMNQLIRKRRRKIDWVIKS